MNNKKGYYSWIHSMKQAALSAQQKGTTMKKLNEEMDSVPVNSRPQFSGKRNVPVPGGVQNASRRPMTLDDFKEIHSRMAAEGDPSSISPEQMYAAYSDAFRRAREDETTQKRYIKGQNDMEPVEVDVTGDGDVDGEDQGQRINDEDLILRGHKFQAAIDDAYYKSLSSEEPRPMPNFPWAHQSATPVPQQHPPAMYSSPEEAEMAVRDANRQFRGEPEEPNDEDFDVLPHEEKPAPAGGAWSHLQSFRESVNDKINRFLN